MSQCKIDHEKEFLNEALGISEDRKEQIIREVGALLLLKDRMSQVFEEICNRDWRIEEKLFAAFMAGSIKEKMILLEKIAKTVESCQQPSGHQ